MKNFKHVFAIIALALVATSSAWAQNSEEAGVRKALEHYLKGHATGDSMEFKQAFHPESKLFWMRDGKFHQRTSANYISGARGKPADDEAQRKRRIDFIDITGNTAVAKITLDYPDALLTDYMSLLKVGDEWKIVNKIFHAEQRKQATK